MRPKTPLGAIAEGLFAGLAGAGLQALFFRASRRIAPEAPLGTFVPPERQQREEAPTETVARRLVEDLAERGPLTGQAKERAGTLVHYGFGAGWGALYGALRSTWPKLWSPLGTSAFAVGVWAVSSNLILPSFRLGAWPQKYPARSHAYSIAAHLVYGAGVAGTLALFDAAPWLGVAAAATVLGKRRPIRSRAKHWRKRTERAIAGARRSVGKIHLGRSSLSDAVGI
jgi:hypothetical protein